MNTTIFNNLVLFNNSIATKREWEIILKGCGAPKNTYFWSALREHCLFKYNRVYKLQDLNLEVFETIWNQYCQNNREKVRKSNDKKKRKTKIAEQLSKIEPRKVCVVNGVVMLGNDYDFK